MSKDHNNDLGKKYQKLDPIEHILKRPDTYIGSIETEAAKLWIYDSTIERLIYKDIVYVPGLFKIFDEILVNAADHFQNNPNKVKEIRVSIDREKNLFSVENDGPGIEIALHPTEKIYIPELIFGNLLTSSNYNDEEERVTGGRNGYGAKLTNIFSVEFTIETVDSQRRKRYKQLFKNNMTKKEPPIITDSTDKPFTRITFKPDLERFKLREISDDFYNLLLKRVYDIAGVTPKSLKVYLNNELIKLEDFKSYVQMYIESTKDPKDKSDSESSDGSDDSSESDSSKINEKKNYDEILFFKPNDRWEVAVALSDNQFQQVSFVNSICTSKGGTHVNYFVDKITHFVKDQLDKNKKGKELDIKPFQIRQHLWVFVNCKIVNPTFDSQTKETMTLKASKFGSDFDLEEKFLKKIIKLGILDHCLKMARAREDLKLMKEMNTGVKKAGKVYGIPKLEDANHAGTRNSNVCTLILTEGDSAKTLAMAGLEVVGRDTFGVFPLKGKLLNVRDANSKKIMENEEIQNIMKILGLNIGAEYENTNKLRYGHILIMTDQDHDGSHIKGLIINFIQVFWPTLFMMSGFLKQFITPIVKVSKGSEVYSFYTITAYKDFIRNTLNNNTKGWKIKYYKGLGTSTEKEAKEYFNEIDKNKINFSFESTEDQSAVELAFAKEKANERKIWLSKFNPISDVMEYDVEDIRYKDFINKELIHFSNSDNIRSIPCICDGLKPSERKVLFSCFKRNLKDEIKVAQLGGYIAEHSAYHHGEMSLQGTIVGMAQNFVGSNNINLLLPLGQFGTRHLGGKDHASSRYIFTNLNKVTRHLFNKDDDQLLNFQVEENMKIEPVWYLPILPLILINGAQGIGTGWSTAIPCYNPREICESIKSKLKSNTDFVENFTPFYKGYKGKITKEGDKYIISGTFEWRGNELVITELPIETWIRPYKDYLEKLMGYDVKEDASKAKKGKKNKKTKKEKAEEKEKDEKKEKNKIIIIEDFSEHHTTSSVEFRIKLVPEYIRHYKENNDKVIKDFKLQTTKSISNLVAFNQNGLLHKYKNTSEIMNDFFSLRYGYYTKRKDYLVSLLQRDLELISNKVKFLEMIINEKLKINNKKKNLIINELQSLKFTPLSVINKIVKGGNYENSEVVKEKEETDETEDSDNDNINNINSIKQLNSKEYDYLLSMPLWNLTLEKILKLKAEEKNKILELDSLVKSSEASLWIKDLDEFLKVLDEVELEEEAERQKDFKQKGKTKKIPKKNEEKKPKKPKAGDSTLDSFVESLSTETEIIENKFKKPLKERLMIDASKVDNPMKPKKRKVVHDSD